VDLEGLELRAYHAVRANRSLGAEGSRRGRNLACFPHGKHRLAREQVASPYPVTAQGPVAGLSLGGHFGQQRFLRVDIVVDHDSRLAAWKTASILRKGHAPGWSGRGAA
jgi:hypothetical protein